jgi:hypothetical protein
MKKQFLILATITTLVFISCSKEKIEAPQANISEEIATASQRPSPVTGAADLKTGLLCWYQFDGNLVDKTGQLDPGYPNAPVSYNTTDRKGARGKAVKFNGNCKIALSEVPHSNSMSLAAWVKYDSVNCPGAVFISSQADGPRFMQAYDRYYTLGNSSTSPYVYSAVMNNQWHFLVATTDGQDLKFYVDGNFTGTIISPDLYDIKATFYNLGSGYTVNDGWRGAIDDLRIYNRVLSAKEVQALFNQ